MEDVKLVVAKDGLEVVRARGDQPHKDLCWKKVRNVPPKVFGLAKPARSIVSPPVAAVGHQLECGGEVLLLGNGGCAQGCLELGGLTPGRSGGYCLVGGHRSQIWDEFWWIWRFSGQKEKGIWRKMKEKQ